MNQVKIKKLLTLTLMCHSIFSQIILKGVKQNVAEKAKV